MRPMLLSEHRDFFYRHGYIEFGGLLSEESTEELYHAVQDVLQPRLRDVLQPQSGDEPEPISPKEIFLAGRDLWRDHPVIKKIVCRPHFAEIVAVVMKQKKIRLAYDQYVVPGSISEGFTLRGMSCFSGLLCGMLLCLSPGEKGDVAPAVVPCTVGNALFFSLDFPLSIDSGGTYLLVAYSESSVIYIKEENDIHTHAPKKYGYVFGDTLRNLTHPLVFH